MSDRRLHLVYFSVLLFGACSYYDASLLEPNDIIEKDAGIEAGIEAGRDTATDMGVVEDVIDDQEVLGDVQDEPGEDVKPETGGCTLARPPDPPTQAEPGGDIEFTAALHSIDFGDLTGNPEQIGFDLDSRCTCQGEGYACLREPWATNEVCDGPNGEDNAAGIAITEIGLLFQSVFSSPVWNAAILDGDWSVILRVSNYNGQLNDTNVRLDWYIPCPFSWGEGGASQPKWDGTDTWPIRSTCLTEKNGNVSLENPKFSDSNAYVTDGVLVASFTVGSFQIYDFSVVLNAAFITGEVVQTEQGWTLRNGMLGARWKLSNLLSQVGRFKFLGQSVCTNHPAYSELKNGICSYADVFSGLGTPTTPCDSLSTGMAFETKPALLGDIIVDPVYPSPCAPEFDPASDSCGS